jgi:hypothetical protein
MLPQFLCAALALAAPVEKPRVHMYMDIYPESPMLGDLVIVRIMAVNIENTAVPAQPWYYFPMFEVGCSESPYRYRLIKPESRGALGKRPRISLAPGERRIVAFDAIELPPIRDIRRDFWVEAQKMGDSIFVVAKGGTLPLWVREDFDKIRLRPPKEVAALLDAYAQERPQGYLSASGPSFGLKSFPWHLATPEKLAELESKLSDGTLRDILRATRLFQIVVVDRNQPRGAAQRRAAAKELLALLDESAELERQWLGYNIFKWFYARTVEPDQIEREFVQAVVRRVPETLVRDFIGHVPGMERFWPALTRELKAKAAGAPAGQSKGSRLLD